MPVRILSRASAPIRFALLATTLALPFALPLHAEGVPDAGAYLAAREASASNDFRRAADYAEKALASDPSNSFLQEAALIADIGQGDMAAAVALAGQMTTGPDGSQLAALVLLTDASQRGDYPALLALVEAGTNTGPLLDGLVRAWAQLGTGDMTQALQGFDALAETQGLAAFGRYHKALALALVGDFEGADAIFAGSDGTPLRATRRSVEAHLQVLSQLERNPDAVAMIDELFGPDPDPGISALRARLVAGEALPFTQVGSARDGLAEVFFTIAGALNTDAADAYTLAYSRFAEYVRPDHVDAILLNASMLEQLHQPDLATEAYARIPRDSDAFYAAELGRAGALYSAGRSDAALEVLEALTRDFPNLPGVWIALGDMQRREARFAEAARSYDSAIALYGDPQPDVWFVYYARGIARERAKDWPKAEADFRTALQLSPEQPQVLNYLGYSYVDMNENLDEALDMIERASVAMPEDGAIADSLGWALYRLGRYAEAVGHMEHAIERMPVDPLVNDHLGDVYWAVGRLREAEFQWRRALSFDPETEADAARIRRKLEVGLDAVLAEEGAPPLKPVPADGN